MVHVYCGNGKGKSTASIGICVRAAGNDIPVLLVQFLKDDTSGELKVLNNLSNVQVMHSDKFFVFTWYMNEE
ncbi:MAG: cob(I)yrinic acid a,c-diamide adenosyltransferase [Lachnospiraceae bacterium]|nr:cob(I)yrinic acid a,c-diamide adenosyltransferase [Lachnospiraceae bacterium]